MVTGDRNVVRNATRRVIESRSLSVMTYVPSVNNEAGPVRETTVLNGTTGVSSFVSRRFKKVMTDVTTSPVSGSTIRMVSGYTPSNGIDNEEPCLSLVIIGTTATRFPALSREMRDIRKLTESVTAGMTSPSAIERNESREATRR